MKVKFAEDRRFTSKDLQEFAGISYRMLTDWDSKGLLPAARVKKKGWRRFTASDLFYIVVASKIRQQFNVPLESLGWLKNTMLRDGTDAFLFSLEKMAYLKEPVGLLTNLNNFLLIETIPEINFQIDGVLTREEDPGAYIFIMISPIINQIVECIDPSLVIKVRRGSRVTSK